MSPAVLLAAAAVGLFALSSKSKAATAGGGGSVADRVRAALATGDAATIRALAAQLRAEGYTAQASDLDRAAAQLGALPSPTSGGGVLKRGSQGEDVRSWQAFLVSQGYTAVAVDGVFGVQTEDATKAFQRARGITADGIVGPDTLAASQKPAPAAVVQAKPQPAALPPLSAPPPSVVVAAPKYMQRGSQGVDVAAWQGFLHSQGYTAVTVDGMFGVQTEDATKAFQRARGLTADGIVGPDTLAASKMAGATPAPSSQPVVVTSAGLPTAGKPTLPPSLVVAPALPPPAPPAPTAARLLQQGTSGTDVSAWQTFLVSQGYTAVAVDGVFGPQTSDATKAFQRARGLTADGVVGPATIAAAAKPSPITQIATAPATPAATATAAAAAAAASGTYSKGISQILKRDSANSQVILWQVFLRTKAGYTTVLVDGKFGVQTEDATKAFQRLNGLTADGIVGPATKAAADKFVLQAAPVAAAPVVTLPAVAASATGGFLAALTIKASAWPVLKQGSKGSAVEEWQIILWRSGYTSIVQDGGFGAATVAATKAWQAARGLTADGIVGPATVAALRAKPPASVTVAGDFFQASSPLPGIIPDGAPPQVLFSADHSLASRVSLHLHQTGSGKEDKELVESFQRQQGLNATGNYGPATGKALMRYGLLPPNPFYWPKQQTQRAMRDYREALLSQAKRDPMRAQEFTAAAARVYA